MGEIFIVFISSLANVNFLSKSRFRQLVSNKIHTTFAYGNNVFGTTLLHFQ